MKRIDCAGWVVACALPLMGMSACGFEQGSESGDQGAPTERAANLGERLAALDADLAPGARGEGVRAVQEYLSQFGYLPNADLANAYPAWRPLVSSRVTAGVYDEATAEAVRSLQLKLGIPDTGIIDAETRTQLTASRCGVPEGIAALDPSDKFSLDPSPRWTSGTVTWKVTNTDDNLSLAAVRGAAAAAFATWAAQTNLTFTQVTSGAADIPIEFGPIGVTNVIAHFQSGKITMEVAKTWSLSVPTGAGSLDFQSVVLHEIGHALGLSHSQFETAVMYPSVNSLPQRRILDVDDDVAISAIYDLWEKLPGAARDIGAGANGSTWIIGTTAVNGGFQIWKWNGSGWDASDGGGVRIAVAPNGFPWIINNSGSIFRRNSAYPNTGTWERIPGGATDIGIGADGSVWITGLTAVGGGFEVWKWNGSYFDKTPEGGGGVRIAVDAYGSPWIVNDVGTIFRRDKLTSNSYFWKQMPGAAHDIGLGDKQYAWLVGTTAVGGGYGIYVWDQQGSVTLGQNLAARAEYQWLPFYGGAMQITVGPKARPWMVNDAGEIFRTTK